jgi:hypothetical protein
VASIAPRAWAEHREVAQLIVEGRADEAAESMSAHVTVSRDTYLATQPLAEPELSALPARAAGTSSGNEQTEIQTTGGRT